MTSSDRWLVGIAGVVGALVLVSLIVTLTSSRPPELLPEGSPERAVQDFLQAIEERDHASAWALLDPEFQAACPIGEFERALTGRTSSIRIRLDEVRTTTTGAEVSVRVTESFSGRPMPSEFTSTQRYSLVEVDGEWRLRAAGWPYFDCTMRRVPSPGTAHHEGGAP
jgi:hypothetical protein